MIFGLFFFLHNPLIFLSTLSNFFLALHVLTILYAWCFNIVSDGWIYLCFTFVFWRNCFPSIRCCLLWLQHNLTGSATRLHFFRFDASAFLKSLLKFHSPHSVGSCLPSLLLVHNIYRYLESILLIHVDMDFCADPTQPACTLGFL